MPHEFLQVAARGLDEQMEVVGHQHVSQDLSLIDVTRSLQKIKKEEPIGIIGKDFLAGITPAGHVIVGILELDSQGPRHQFHSYQNRKVKSRIKI